MTKFITSVQRFLARLAASWSELFVAENQGLFPPQSFEKPFFCGTKFCALAQEPLSGARRRR